MYADETIYVRENGYGFDYGRDKWDEKEETE